MNFIKKQFNFLRKNNNLRDSVIKSIVSGKYLIVPQKDKLNGLGIKYNIVNNKFHKAGEIQLYSRNSKLFLNYNIKYNYLAKSHKNKILIEFINSILNSLNEDNLYLKLKDYSDIKNLKGFEFIFEKNYLRLSKVSNNKKQILTAGPSISEKEKFYVFDATEKGWNNNWSNYLTKFENLFSKKMNQRYCLSTSSCTGAMHIALLALGIKKGDEVIVPDITWVATASVVVSVGAIPVFADVDKDDWTISIKSIEKLISKKTKAIMPVHLYGMPAKLEQLKKISKKYNLKIIEDAAPAIGSKSFKIKSGCLGEFSAFSFQGAKLLVTGEGGILTTSNKFLYEKAKKILDFGRSKKKTFWIDSIGVKYKMSNIQAALGFGQLERLDQLVMQKRKIFKFYEKFLIQNNFKLIKEKKGTKSIYWMTCILIDKNFKRDELINVLKKNHIDCRPCFPSISEYPIWHEYRSDVLKNSKIIAKQGLNLPSGVNLKEKDIKRVSSIINKFFGQNSVN